MWRQIWQTNKDWLSQISVKTYWSYSQTPKKFWKSPSVYEGRRKTHLTLENHTSVWRQRSNTHVNLYYHTQVWRPDGILTLTLINTAQCEGRDRILTKRSEITPQCGDKRHATQQTDYHMSAWIQHKDTHVLWISHHSVERDTWYPYTCISDYQCKNRHWILRKTLMIGPQCEDKDWILT